MPGGQTERQVQLINDFRPDIIMVTPSYKLALLGEFERQGLDARESSLSVGNFGAEPWTEDMRREVEERAGRHAVDNYGLSEVIGPGVACECVETKDGLHVWEDHFHPEISTRRPVACCPTASTASWCSPPSPRAMIVRYRRRDLIRLLPGTARTLRRSEKITGRSDDMLIVRGVNVFPARSRSC